MIRKEIGKSYPSLQLNSSAKTCKKQGQKMDTPRQKLPNNDYQEHDYEINSCDFSEILKSIEHRDELKSRRESAILSIDYQNSTKIEKKEIIQEGPEQAIGEPSYKIPLCIRPLWPKNTAPIFPKIISEPSSLRTTKPSQKQAQKIYHEFKKNRHMQEIICKRDMNLLLFTPRMVSRLYHNQRYDPLEELIRYYTELSELIRKGEVIDRSCLKSSPFEPFEHSVNRNAPDPHFKKKCINSPDLKEFVDPGRNIPLLVKNSSIMGTMISMRIDTFEESIQDLAREASRFTLPKDSIHSNLIKLSKRISRRDWKEMNIGQRLSILLSLKRMLEGKNGNETNFIKRKVRLSFMTIDAKKLVKKGSIDQ